MKTGDKVVCVDFRPNEHYCVAPPLLKGVVYVVREAGEWHNPSGTVFPFINLVGVRPFADTVGWKPERFRLLDELKQEAGKRQELQIA